MARKRLKFKSVGDAFTHYREKFLQKLENNISYRVTISEVNRLQRLMEYSGCWEIKPTSMNIYMWADMEETLARGGEWKPSKCGQRVAKPYGVVSIKKLRAQFFAFTRWLAIKELVDVGFYERLKLLPVPRAGVNGVMPKNPVRAVPVEELQRYEPFVPICLWDYMKLGWLTGARPGELSIIAGECIKPVGDGIWVYNPVQHKGLWRGDDRSIYFGPHSMQIIKLYSALAPEDAIFNFKTMSDQFHELTYNRPQQERTYRRWRAGKGGVDKSINTIQLIRFFDRARRIAKERGVDLPIIKPNQLRHSAATRIREKYGIEGAAVALQDTEKQALIYAERSKPLAIQIAKEMM